MQANWTVRHTVDVARTTGTETLALVGYTPNACVGDGLFLTLFVFGEDYWGNWEGGPHSTCGEAQNCTKQDTQQPERA